MALLKSWPISKTEMNVLGVAQVATEQELEVV